MNLRVWIGLKVMVLMGYILSRDQFSFSLITLQGSVFTLRHFGIRNQHEKIRRFIPSFTDLELI